MITPTRVEHASPGLPVTEAVAMSTDDQATHLQLLAEQLQRDLDDFAGELHDGVLQYVIAAQMLGERLRMSFEQQGQAVPSELVLLREHLQQALLEGRRLLDGIRSLDWQSTTLDLELRRLADEIGTVAGVTTQLSVMPLGRLPPGTSQQFYRIAQEALHNVRRHSGATEVTISFRVIDQYWELRIADNGCGFDPSAVAPGHFGLIGLRRRAALMGGSCQIVSEPGRGTTIAVSVPTAARIAPSPSADA